MHHDADRTNPGPVLAVVLCDENGAPAAAIRQALDAAPGATHVAFVRPGDEVPAVVPSADVTVTSSPVTDAVKRVEDTRVVETLDRTTLRVARLPLVALRRLVEEAVTGDDDLDPLSLVRPGVAVGGG